MDCVQQMKVLALTCCRRTLLKAKHCCGRFGPNRKLCTAVNKAVIKSPPWRILFFGTNDFSVATLKLLHENRVTEYRPSGLVEALEVVTGSKKEPDTPVRKYALQHGLKTYLWPPFVGTDDYDLGIVASFGHLIPEKIIRAFPWGMINVHASLLPRWRGAAPIVHTILNGDKKTGVSIMKIEPKHFDIGHVLLQRSCLVSDCITAKQLTAVLAELGAQLIVDCLKDLPTYLSNSAPQDINYATKAPKIKPSMSLVNWSVQSCENIDRLYRAIGDTHKLQTTWKESSVKLDDFVAPSNMDTLKIELLFSQQRGIKTVSSEPGDIYFHRKRNILCVRCLDGWIGVKSVQVSGFKTYSPREFYNGFLSKVKPPERHFSNNDAWKIACSV